MERTCLECGARLAGRSDKKFCADQCRTSYNNRLNAETNKSIRNINNILKRNRRILAALRREGMTMVPGGRLREAGFDFAYFTGIRRLGRRKTCYFCYEEGYLPQGKGRYRLFREKGRSGDRKGSRLNASG